MICSTGDGLFALYWFYALHMLKFCCSFDVEAYMPNLMISRCRVLLIVLC